MCEAQICRWHSIISPFSLQEFAHDFEKPRQVSTKITLLKYVPSTQNVPLKKDLVERKYFSDTLKFLRGGALCWRMLIGRTHLQLLKPMWGCKPVYFISISLSIVGKMEQKSRIHSRWTDDEVQALLSTSAEEVIQRDFKSASRNDQVYGQIADKLVELNVVAMGQTAVINPIRLIWLHFPELWGAVGTQPYGECWWKRGYWYSHTQ